jgi:hypothetical protein
MEREGLVKWVQTHFNTYTEREGRRERERRKRRRRKTCHVMKETPREKMACDHRGRHCCGTAKGKHIKHLGTAQEAGKDGGLDSTRASDEATIDIQPSE